MTQDRAGEFHVVIERKYKSGKVKKVWDSGPLELGTQVNRPRRHSISTDRVFAVYSSNDGKVRKIPLDVADRFKRGIR